MNSLTVVLFVLSHSQPMILILTLTLPINDGGAIISNYWNTEARMELNAAETPIYVPVTNNHCRVMRIRDLLYNPEGITSLT